MERSKKVFISLTIVGCIIAIALITTSFATEYWITAEPFLGNPNSTNYVGTVHFGLFSGSQELNYHGLRVKQISVKEYAFTYKIVDASIWIATIVLGSLGIVWGMVSICFALFNVFGRPIETLAGEMGLYLWNAIACIFSLLCVIVFAVHFTQDLTTNVLQEADTTIGWTSADTAYPGWSFWLCVAASGIYLVNILLVICSGTALRLPRYNHSAEKALDGVMMY